MTINNLDHPCKSPGQSLGPFELFVVGWKLIISELFWFLSTRFRVWEMRQLRKRLNIENIRLARLVRKKAAENRLSLDLTDPEIDLALGQVELLREEIVYLKMEMQAKRGIFVESRKQKYLKNQEY